MINRIPPHRARKILSARKKTAHQLHTQDRISTLNTAHEILVLTSKVITVQGEIRELKRLIQGRVWHGQ